MIRQGDSLPTKETVWYFHIVCLSFRFHNFVYLAFQVFFYPSVTGDIVEGEMCVWRTQVYFGTVIFFSQDKETVRYHYLYFFYLT